MLGGPKHRHVGADALRRRLNEKCEDETDQQRRQEVRPIRMFVCGPQTPPDELRRDRANCNPQGGDEDGGNRHCPGRKSMSTRSYSGRIHFAASDHDRCKFLSPKARATFLSSVRGEASTSGLLLMAFLPGSGSRRKPLGGKGGDTALDDFLQGARPGPQGSTGER